MNAKAKLNAPRVLFSRFFNFLYWRTKVSHFRRISNKLIKGLVVRVNDVALVLTDISGLYEQAKPHYEKAQFDYIINHIHASKKNKIVFVDVGANIGRYSLFLAKRYPINAIAIEPDPEAYSALVKGIKINNLNNVIALNVAASDVDDFVTLLRKRSPSISSIVDKTDVIETIRVRARRLDNMVQELNVNCVDIVKIDVEGAELHVLRGFKGSIVKFKPKIIIEVKEFNRKEVFEFFEEVNYACHHIPEDESGEYFICAPRS